MLIAKDQFIGLENVIHLAAGGESPALKSHQQAVARFLADKGLGEVGRERLAAVYTRAKEKAGRLLGVPAGQIAFLPSASDGVNLLAHALDWRPGDNVVVADVEFPSDILPWLRLADRGVEVRLVRHRDWKIHLEDIAALIDERTRVVAASHVSYFTGQRLPLAELSALVRRSQALLLVDATHAAGVVPVDATYADVLVSSCYKWLLATHGLGLFYWNPERLPALQPPFLGWHSCRTIPQWDAPTAYELKPDGGRFEPANPSFISIYLLDNALDHILEIGVPAIAAHVLRLSSRVWEGLAAAGCEMMTPRAAAERAGNVCFMAEEIEAITAAFKKENILVWGSYAGVTRVRVSTHLYNSDAEIDRFLDVVQQVFS